MRLLRPISLRTDARIWLQGWPCAGTSVTRPPILQDGYNAVTAFGNWYLSNNAAPDPNNSWVNYFQMRVSQWDVFGETGKPFTPDILISPRNGLGITEPIRIGFDGATDWVEDTSFTELIGDRSAFVDHEVILPAANPTVIPPQSEGAFSFHVTKVFHNTAVPSQPTITLDLYFYWDSTLALLYNQESFVPCKCYYKWRWTGDDGIADGGWLSHWSEWPNAVLPPVIEADPSFNVYFRVSDYPLGSTTHQVPLALQAYKFQCAGITGGLTDTGIYGQTVSVLEVDGENFAANVWVQPATTIPGSTPYFEYKKAGLAVYDKDTGVALMDPIPMAME